MLLWDLITAFLNPWAVTQVCVVTFVMFCWPASLYNPVNTTNLVHNLFLVRGGADKSLARPGRKWATATKLGIYSTYSPRSSIYFLARCSNFCKPLKKNTRKLSAQPGLHGNNDLRVGRKMANFQLFFSVQGIGGSPTGSDAESGVGDQDIGSPGRSVSSGLQMPGEPGRCHARTRSPWWTFQGFSPSKCPSIAPTEMSNTPRW